MSRSGYSDDCEQWSMIRWRGAVASAIRGKRGQAFLRELLDALDALPEKRLIAGDIVREGEVCAIGALGLRRGVDMTALDPEDHEAVAGAFGIPNALACELFYENDEVSEWTYETVQGPVRPGQVLPYVSRRVTPEERFVRVRAWIVSSIKDTR